MQILLQSVTSAVTEINKKFRNYVLGLILTSGLKNCTSMARELFVQSRIYYNYLRLPAAIQAFIKNRLVEISENNDSEGKKSALIVDSTFIPKPFGRLLQNIGYHFDGVQKRVNRGLCLVVIAKVNGKSVAMLDFEFYIGKKACRENYQTKIDIAKRLIKGYYNKIKHDYVCMDGGFMSESMISFLKSIKSKFIMRIPRNRLVEINGICMRLSLHPAFKLIKNQKTLTRSGYYKGHKCFFTIQKRKKKGGGHQIVFLVSNIETEAKLQLKLYSNRWPIEKGFRTMKQKLGFSDCRMITNSQQTNHILTVFFTYSLLELVKISKRKKSVDEILNSLRSKKDPPESYCLSELIVSFT